MELETSLPTQFPTLPDLLTSGSPGISYYWLTCQTCGHKLMKVLVHDNNRFNPVMFVDVEIKCPSCRAISIKKIPFAAQWG